MSHSYHRESLESVKFIKRLDDISHPADSDQGISHQDISDSDVSHPDVSDPDVSDLDVSHPRRF